MIFDLSKYYSAIQYGIRSDMYEPYSTHSLLYLCYLFCLSFCVLTLINYSIPQAQVPTSSSDEDREVCNNNNATTKVRQPHTSSDEDREVDVMSTTPPPPPTQASTSAENAGVGVASPGVGGATFGVGGPSAGHLQQPRQQHFKQELTSPPMSQQPAPPQQPQGGSWQAYKILKILIFPTFSPRKIFKS